MFKERFGGISIWLGLLWVLLAWFTYISGYAGFGAGLLALPLSMGYWFTQAAIEPLSTTVANYLNAFVISVPAGVLSSLIIGRVLSAIIKVCQSRIVFLRPQSRRKLKFARTKSAFTVPLWRKSQDSDK